MTTIEQRLRRIHNRRTLYEIIIEKGEERYLVQYASKSRNAILRGLRRHGEAIAARFGDTVTFARRSADGAYVGDWHVRYSGRTEREAIIAGEYPTAW